MDKTDKCKQITDGFSTNYRIYMVTTNFRTICSLPETVNLTKPKITGFETKNKIDNRNLTGTIYITYF